MKMIRLGDLTKIKTGKLDANASSENGIYPFFTCSREPLKIDSYSYDCECVLVAGNGDLNVKYYKGKFDAYQRTYIVESNDPSILDVKYLYYFLETYLHKLREQSIGGVIKYIKLGNLTDATIPLFDLETQLRIVDILTKTKNLVNLRKKQISELSSLTRSVFLEMFGDPQTNKMNWNLGTIKDLTLKTQYGTSKKASENKGDFPILRMNNLSYEGRISLSDLKYVDLDEKETDLYLVRKGEILFNRTNSKELVGKTAVFNFEEPMAYAGYLVKLIPNNNANAFFISGYLNSDYGKRVLYNMAKSIVGMANINAEELKRIKIYLPPVELQNEYALIINKIEEKRDLLNKSLIQFENSYQSLLHQAFNGKLSNSIIA